jgi:hypothetical protein
MAFYPAISDIIILTGYSDLTIAKKVYKSVFMIT